MLLPGFGRSMIWSSWRRHNTNPVRFRFCQNCPRTLEGSGQLWAGQKDGRLLGEALFRAIPPQNSKDGLAQRCCWCKVFRAWCFIPIEHEKTKFGQIKFHDNEVEQIDLTRYEIGLHGWKSCQEDFICRFATESDVFSDHSQLFWCVCGEKIWGSAAQKVFQKPQ